MGSAVTGPDRPERRALYAVLLVLVLSVVLAMLQIWYTNRVAQQSNRNWCSLVTNLDNAYRQQPPPSELGKKIASDMHNLRERLGC